MPHRTIFLQLVKPTQLWQSGKFWLATGAGLWLAGWLLLVAGTSLAAVSSGDGNWFWQNPLPQGTSLNHLTCLDPDHCLAVGNNGTILTYQGGDWTGYTPKITNIDLNGITCITLTNCMAVGNNGTILRYDGTAWTAMTSPVVTSLYGLSCLSATNCYAVGAYDVILAFDGTGWSKVWPPQTGPFSVVQPDHGPQEAHTFYAVSCLNPARCFAVGYDRIVTFDGTGWGNPVDLGGITLKGISCPGPSLCLAVGQAAGGIAQPPSTTGVVWAYDGTTWTLQTTSPHILNDLYCVNASNCRAVGESGFIFNFNGTGWQAVTPAPTNLELRGIACPSATRCLAVGRSGLILSFDGLANSWTTVSSSVTSGTLRGVSCPNPLRCVAVGDSGLLLGYDGTGWMAMASPTPTDWNAVSCAQVGDCLAVGNGGKALRLQGGSWYPVSVPAPTGLNLRGVSCPASNACYVVGDSGLLLTYNGLNWQTPLSPTSKPLYSISCPTPTYCVAVGGSGSTIISLKNTVWTDNSLAGFNVNLSGVSCWAIEACLAVGGDNKAFRLDGANGWTAAPDLPGTSYPSAVGCPVAGVCYAVGTSNGGQLMTFNGSSWNGASAGAANGLNAINCVNELTCATVGSGGAILARQSILEVTTAADTNTTGTLRYALSQAQSGQIIKFRLPLNATNTINIAAKLPAPASGVSIQAGCSPSGPSVTLDGSAIDPLAQPTVDGLSLEPGATVNGLLITHFPGRQLVAGNVRAALFCTRTVK